MRNRVVADDAAQVSLEKGIVRIVDQARGGAEAVEHLGADLVRLVRRPRH